MGVCSKDNELAFTPRLEPMDDLYNTINEGYEGDDWEYPDPTCMECGNECRNNEEVSIGSGGPFELWCYCPACKVETFHPRRKESRRITR